jgi:hypothetical protein
VGACRGSSRPRGVGSVPRVSHGRAVVERVHESMEGSPAFPRPGRVSHLPGEDRQSADHRPHRPCTVPGMAVWRVAARVRPGVVMVHTPCVMPSSVLLG